jgi:hypothetical protein
MESVNNDMINLELSDLNFTPREKPRKNSLVPGSKMAKSKGKKRN